MVTGDRDLFQLVDDAHQVRVIYTSRGGVRNADVVDEAFLRDRYAVPNGDAYADMSILRGDTSDGLPGVAGIGEKTAAALIERYGDLAGLRAAVDSGDPAIKGAQRTRLEAASAYLDVAPLVVRVARDAPLPKADLALPTKVADARLLSKVASEYGVTLVVQPGPVGVPDRLGGMPVASPSSPGRRRSRWPWPRARPRSLVPERDPPAPPA